MALTINISIVALLLLRQTMVALASMEVLLLISSQNTPYHRYRSELLRTDILRQKEALAVTEVTAMSPIPQDYVINVHIMHEIFNYPGDWTILDALPYLIGETRLLNDNTKWIILCQDNTNVSLRRLLNRLAQENCEELSYHGHALHDQEATIIHHFAFFKNPTWFPYPMLSAGIIFTGRLLRILAKLVADNKIPRHSEFSIDAAHELARYIFDNVTPPQSPSQSASPVAAAATTLSPGPKLLHKTPYNEWSNGSSSNSNSNINTDKNKSKEEILVKQKSRKIILKSAAYICPKAPMKSTLHKASEDCLLYAKPEGISNKLAFESDATPMLVTPPTSTCRFTSGHDRSEDREDGDSSSIYFAIKTCAKFHKERVPIIESTWANYAVFRQYYSDVTDPDIPTVATGVPNVETGHCAKTLAILQLSLKDIEEQMKHKRARFIRWIALVDDDTLLSVSRLSALLNCQDPRSELYLGERYGYRLYAADGFNYITGGGGIIFSLPLARRVIATCSCPSPMAPDDMIIGYCLQALGVHATHSSQFHQARPQDYPLALLKLSPPISFHKFWQLDPLLVYETWFAAADRKMAQRRRSKMRQSQYNNGTLALRALKQIGRREGGGQLLDPLLGNRLRLYETLAEASSNKHLDL